MQVKKEYPVKSSGQCVLALGNFDGVHLGHRRLLESGKKKALELGVKLSVLIFEPHPLKYLFPERVLGFLTTQEQQLEIFEEIGVDTVYILPFDHQMANKTPKEFVESILIPIGVKHIIVGFNYTFGVKGQGTPELLQKFGDEYNFGLSVLQAQTLDNRVISSTAIRKELLQGNIIEAKKMLGRPPSINGKVVKGEQRGRILGFPTANIKVAEDYLIPKRGVYAAWARYKGKIIQGMMNIGMKPTFHDEYEQTLEINFFDFNEDLYGQELTIYIEDRIRDEQKFNGIDELINQLHLDAENVKKVFSTIALQRENNLV